MAAVLDLVEEIQETHQQETHQGERPLKRLFTLEEFAKVVDALPDDRLELIKGEIVMSPPPDFPHIKQTVKIEGYIIDNACAGNHAKDADFGDRTKKHSTSCALMPNCAKSGYALVTSDGKFLKFDESGNARTLAALKKSVKDLTQKEFEQWVKEGRFDSRELDGKRYFMSASASNLFFRHPELDKRRLPPKETAALERAVLKACQVIRKTAQSEKKPYVLPKQFQVTMTVTAKAGAAPPGGPPADPNHHEDRRPHRRRRHSLGQRRQIRRELHSVRAGDVPRSGRRTWPVCQSFLRAERRDLQEKQPAFPVRREAHRHRDRDHIRLLDDTRRRRHLDDALQMRAPGVPEYDQTFRITPAGSENPLPR